ncbi:unnamed protein product [Effrenium voratum]|nr:unnamed protein product [Effrenium voratum]
MWLGMQTRNQYLQLQADFRKAEGSIIIMQRYMRGCLCRGRLWREAVSREERVWAAIEIQRRWRGYRGRVRFESTMEQIWRREMAAAMLQRNLRGWVARAKIARRRRQAARAEFEKARRRFLAAQRIQAKARGMLARKVVHFRLARANHAASRIQSVHRGGMVRTRMWEQIRAQRVILIQAGVRGRGARNLTGRSSGRSSATGGGRLAACGRTQWREALEILTAMPRQRLESTVSTVSQNMAMRACQAAWRRTLLLLPSDPDVVSFNTALAALRSVSWHLAWQLLDSQEEQSVQADIVTYNTLVTSCDSEGLQLWRRGAEALRLCRHARLEPDGIGFNSLISSCVRGRRWAHAFAIAVATRADAYGRRSAAGGSHWRLALAILAPEERSARRAAVLASSGCSWAHALHWARGVRRNVIVYNSAMAGSPWRTARQLLSPGSHVSFGAALGACKPGAWRPALELLGRMLVLRFAPNRICCNAALACVGPSAWWQCLQLLRLGGQQLADSSFILASNLLAAGQWHRAHGLLGRRNSVACGLALSALAVGDAWQSAEALLRSAVHSRLRADVAMHNCAAARWPAALGLLGRVRDAGLAPNGATMAQTLLAHEKASLWQLGCLLVPAPQDVGLRNGLLAACGRGHWWCLSLELLGGFRRTRLVADSISFNATIDVCEKCSRWAESLELLATAPSPDERSFKVSLSACGRAEDWRRSLRLLARMSSRDMLPSAWVFETSADLCEKLWAKRPLPRLLEDMSTAACDGLGSDRSRRSRGTVRLGLLKQTGWECMGGYVAANILAQPREERAREKKANEAAEG